jgi:hypothetical protein
MYEFQITKTPIVKSRQQLYKEAKRALRRNVKLRLKQGFWEDLPEQTKKSKQQFDDEVL